jgi:hypothetical protein
MFCVENSKSTVACLTGTRGADSFGYQKDNAQSSFGMWHCPLKNNRVFGRFVFAFASSGTKPSVIVPKIDVDIAKQAAAACLYVNELKKNKVLPSGFTERRQFLGGPSKISAAVLLQSSDKTF